MRKLIFQVQMTLDGFVAGPEGQLDWMWAAGRQDPDGLRKVVELADDCDTILMGRKMSREFIDYWESVVDNQPDSIDHPLATRMVDMQKIVFSRTQTSIKGRNAVMENGDLATVVKALKNKPGKDILVYGGAAFAASLIDLDLVDAYNIFRSPVAIGKGLSVFQSRKVLELVGTTSYKNGKVLEQYLKV